MRSGDLDDYIMLQHKLSKEFSEYIKPGAVNCVLTSSVPDNKNKIRAVYGLPIIEGSLASRIKRVIDNNVFRDLTNTHSREVIELPCSELQRGDAWGWMKAFSKDDYDNLIIVLENITRIPDDDPAKCDPKDFLEDLLVRTWRHDHICVGDINIDRSKLTIILSAPVEDAEKFESLCRGCDFNWVDLDRIFKKLARL